MLSNKKCQHKNCKKIITKGNKKLSKDCGYCFKSFCITCSKKNSCGCGFICGPCRKRLYTRECFDCSGSGCSQLLCQQCMKSICSNCTNAYCFDCDYGNISHCTSCGEKKCNDCMDEIPSNVCLDCIEISDE
jgi:hypothetical protein